MSFKKINPIFSVYCKLFFILIVSNKIPDTLKHNKVYTKICSTNRKDISEYILKGGSMSFNYNSFSLEEFSLISQVVYLIFRWYLICKTIFLLLFLYFFFIWFQVKSCINLKHWIRDWHCFWSVLYNFIVGLNEGFIWKARRRWF